MGDSKNDHANDRMIESTNQDEVTKEILEYISNSHKPCSTQEIAQKIDRPWHSVQTRCLQLQLQDKVIGFKAGRMNLWQKKQ